MCGRVVDDLGDAEWRRYWGLPRPLDEANYNVAPTDLLAIVVEEAGRRLARVARWGLVPDGMRREDARGLSTFNARSESVATKPVFARAFASSRCLVPVRGFYEWAKRRDGTKVPHFLRRRDGKPLVLAGLYARREDHEGELVTATVLTCPPCPEVEPLHDRMPVVLLSRDWDAWLSPTTRPRELRDLLRPFTAGVLEAYPVDAAVGKAGRSDPGMIARPRWRWEYGVAREAGEEALVEVLGRGVAASEADARAQVLEAATKLAPVSGLALWQYGARGRVMYAADGRVAMHVFEAPTDALGLNLGARFSHRRPERA